MRLRLYTVVVPILLCITSSGAFADTANPDPATSQRNPTPAARMAKILDEAIQLHCKGQVAEATVKYQQVARESGDITQIRHARFAIAACELSLKQYDAAIATFDAYARDYPDDAYGPLATVHAGTCLAEQGRLAEAAPYYEKAVKIKQNKEDMVVWIGWAHLGMGKALVNDGRYTDALTHLEQAITNPSEVKVSTEAIELLLDDLTKLEQFGAAGSEIAQAYFVLGKFYYDQRKCDQALPYLQRAAKLAPDEPLRSNVYTILGEALQAAGRLEEASKAFQSARAATALNDDPESKALTAQTMQSCIDAGDWESVCRICEAMQRDYPDDIETWGIPLIHAYLDVGKPRYEKGIPVCKSIVARVSDPKTVVDALTVLAECMYPLGKGEEAVAFQNAYFAKHPDLKFEADWVRARTAYYAERNLAKAAPLLEKLVADYRDRASEPLPLLADALQFTGQTQKAVDAIDALVKSARGQQWSDLAMRKADLYYAGKKYREAAEAYKAAIDAPGASPDHLAKATYQLALCYDKSGLTRSAQVYMQRVSENYPRTQWAKMARGTLYLWENGGM